MTAKEARDDNARYLTQSASTSSHSCVVAYNSNGDLRRKPMLEIIKLSLLSDLF